MPLAPGHPAAVLPLQRLGLPLSPLVVGAVAPDAPVYLPLGIGYATTHSGRGVVVSAGIGLGLLLLWYAVLRDPVVDLVPALRDRLPRRARLDRAGWVLAPPALLIGSATHVLWDSATHDWGFVVEGLGVLRENYGRLPLYSWLQHISTVGGSAVVAAYGIAVLRRRPLVPRPPSVRRPALWLTPIPLSAIVVGLVLRDVDAAVSAALAALLGVAVAWRAARSRA